MKTYLHKLLVSFLTLMTAWFSIFIFCLPTHAAEDNFVSYNGDMDYISEEGNFFVIRVPIYDATDLDFTTSEEIYTNGTRSYHSQNGTIVKNLDLTYAYFSAATASGANFSGKDLSYATFRSAELKNANFTGANLSNASFSYANFDGTILNNAIITNANFADTDMYFGPERTLLTQAQLATTKSYKDKVLGAVNFSFNDLRGWNFSDQDMKRADFSYARIADTNFSGANLQNADFTSAMGGVNFSGANLQNVDFRDANLTEANFRNADLTYAHFNSTVALAGNASTLLTNADFTDAIIYGASFAYGTRVYHLTHIDMDFTLAQLMSTKSYKDKNLGPIDLGYFVLTNMDFSGQNLEGANLTCTELQGVNFTDANIRNVNFSGAGNIGPLGGGLQGPNFNQISSTKSFKEKDLSGVVLTLSAFITEIPTDPRNGKFTGWNLSGQNLEGASLGGQMWGYENDFKTDGSFTISAQPDEVDEFGNPILDENGIPVYLERWSLNLTDANIKGVRFYGNLTNAPYDPNDTSNNYGNLTFAQLASTKSYKEKNLVGVSFSNINIAGWDFTGQNMQGFWDSWPGGIFSMTNTNFTSADLRHASPNQIYPGAIFKNTIMAGGTIQNLEMIAAGDYIHVRRDEISPLSPVNVVLAMGEDVTFSGNSRLILDEGGVFEIKEGARLKVEDANIDFHVGNTESGTLLVKGILEFTGETNFNIYLADGFSAELSDLMLITFEELDLNILGFGTSSITGEIIGTIAADQISLWNADKSAFEGVWNFSLDERGLSVSIQPVPEPSTYATIVGLLVLGFVIYKRRKS